MEIKKLVGTEGDGGRGRNGEEERNLDCSLIYSHHITSSIARLIPPGNITQKTFYYFRLNGLETLSTNYQFIYEYQATRVRNRMAKLR